MALTFHICNAKLVNLVSYLFAQMEYIKYHVLCSLKYIYIRQFPSSSGCTIEISIGNVAINIVIFRLKLSRPFTK